MRDSRTQEAQEQMLNFFELVAKKDKGTIQQLRQFGFTTADGKWKFTLTDLHDLLVQRYAYFREIDYPSFRALLYRSPVNRHIREFGAEIAVSRNRHHVDHSEYVLLWKSKSS